MILLFAVLAILVNCVLMLVFFRRLSARLSPDRILGEIRGELDRLVADLGRETDRDVALLENRIQGLRSLIDEADRRIVLAGRETAKRLDEEATLEALSRPAATPTRKPVPAEPSPAAGAVSPPETAGPLSAGTEVSGADSGPVGVTGVYSRASIARSRIANGERRIEPVVPTRERVVSLADRGFSPDLIASKLSLSLGEVELILDMHFNAPVPRDDTNDSRS